MRVALVHDWLTGMRGGEQVLLRLCDRFPDAPIYTLVWRRGSVAPAIESHPIRTSFLQAMPGATTHWRWYLPLFPAAIESLDLAGFDLVVSSSHAVAKGVRTPPGTLHVSYVYTPMRYVWELERDYFGGWPPPLSWAVAATCARLRRWDVATAGRPDVLIADSAHVAARIRRHWGRDARVLYPPAAIERFRAAAGPRSGYLLAGAFAPYKKGALAIEACARMPRPLKVSGAGQLERPLRRMAAPGIEFLGWVDDTALPDLYASARALLFPGEEDFGIVPIEAMASGCPVIAYGKGGVLETVGRGASPDALARVAQGGVGVVPGGVLFGTQSAEGLMEAIRCFEAHAFDPRALRAQAELFSTEAFDQGLEAILDTALQDPGARAAARALP